MANKLTYISSGIPYQRLAFKEVIENPETNAWMRKAYKSMQERPNHKYGLMFNAFVEANFGPVLREQFVDVLDDIHADSGGLQVVTRGLEFTPEMKAKIFETQGKYSFSAMSFDEIPLKFTGTKSSRLDLSNRWFDRDNFEGYARQTGRNVFEQIQAFENMNSPAKPIVIVHGNCYDTYMKWAELVLEEIPQQYHERIGGVAMGAAALGHGTLEDIKRAFYYTELPIKTQSNHMHLLAVGSVARLLPNLVFLQNGVYKDMHLTYDSTTHTSGIHMGRYYLNRRNLEFPRAFDRQKWGKMYDDMCSKFDINFTLEEYHWLLNGRSDPVRERYGDRNLMIQSNVAGILGQIENFREHVDHCLESKKNLIKFASSIKKGSVFDSLYDVKNKTDFDRWIKHVGAHVPSNPVSGNKASNLERFFG